MQPLLTVKQVAEYLQASEQSVIRWIKGGKLEAAKVGQQWRISQEQVDQFLSKDK